MCLGLLLPPVPTTLAAVVNSVKRPKFTVSNSYIAQPSSKLSGSHTLPVMAGVAH